MLCLVRGRIAFAEMILLDGKLEKCLDKLNLVLLYIVLVSTVFTSCLLPLTSSLTRYALRTGSYAFTFTAKMVWVGGFY